MTQALVNLPAAELRAFRRNVFRGEAEKAIATIEEHQIDACSILDPKENASLVAECISGHKYWANARLVAFLLERGADPNLKDTSDLNAFHRAIFTADLDLCELLLCYEVEVNAQEQHGYSAFFLFLRECYASLAWKGIALKKRCLHIVEEFLKRGADADLMSHFDTCPRSHLCPEVGSVRRLMETYDDREIPKQQTTEQTLPSNLAQPEVAREIWKRFVPRSGPSDCVQGELLRAVEKLRDEAQRNGNTNYSRMHRDLANYLKDTLGSQEIFAAETLRQIRSDTKLLMSARKPYLDDDVYDRLTDRICELYLANKEPMPR